MAGHASIVQAVTLLVKHHWHRKRIPFDLIHFQPRSEAGHVVGSSLNHQSECENECRRSLRCRLDQRTPGVAQGTGKRCLVRSRFDEEVVPSVVGLVKDSEGIEIDSPP